MRILRSFSGQSSRVYQSYGSQQQKEQVQSTGQPIVSYCDLGRDIETDEIVSLGDVERRSGLYILGKPGMGKTTLMVNMILQDIEHGHGLCFLDPAGDAIEEVLKRLPDHRKQDVILLDPLDKQYAFGLNLFQCDDPTDPIQVSETLNTVLEVFAKLFTQTGNFEDAPAMFDTLFSTIILLIYNPSYTLTDVPVLLMSREASAKLIPNIRETHEDVRQWWQAYNAEKRFEERNKLTGSTRRRLQPFLTNEMVRHIVGQPTTIDMRSIMDEGKILLVKLPRTQPQVTTLVGNLLIDRLLHAAYAREALREEKRRHFCLYCDEFQNYATSDFAKLITEARKYRIATTIAHQERYGQLEVDRRVLGATLATAHKVVFQPTINDAEAVAWEFAKRAEPARLEVLSEEERVVVEQEKLERIVDEIENGVEPIPALAQNPLTHLLRGHSNQEVNRLAGRVLQPLANALQIAQAETEQASVWDQKISQERVFHHMPDGESGMEYVATREQLLQGEQQIDRLLFDLMQGSMQYGSREVANRLLAIITSLRAFIGFASGVEWNVKSETSSWIEFVGSGRRQRAVERGRTASSANWIDAPLDPETDQLLHGLVSVVVREVPTALEDGTVILPVSSPSETQQAFVRARLFHYWQAGKEERDRQVLSGLTSGVTYNNEYPTRCATSCPAQRKWLQNALCCMHGFGVALLAGRQKTSGEEQQVW
jgi:hypothetical protein